MTKIKDKSNEFSSGSIAKEPDFKAPTGLYKKRKVAKEDNIKLRTTVLDKFKFLWNKIPFKRVFALKDSSKSYITNKKNKKIQLSNENLNNLYIAAVKNTNAKEVHEMLVTFLQTIATEYSATKPPSIKDRNSLYDAYTQISARYYYLDQLNNLTNNAKSTEIKFASIIKVLLATKNTLQQSTHNQEFIYTNKQTLLPVLEENYKFVCEDCLGIFISADPELSLSQAKKTREYILSKGVYGKEDTIEKQDEIIDTALADLSYVNANNMVTPKYFIVDIIDKTFDLACNELNKQIILHIKEKKLQDKDRGYVINNIIEKYKNDLTTITTIKKTAENRLSLIKDLILENYTPSA